MLSGWPCTGAGPFDRRLPFCCLLAHRLHGDGLAAAQPLHRVQTCPQSTTRMRIESSPRAGDCARLRGDHPRRVMAEASARVMVKHLAAAGGDRQPTFQEGSGMADDQHYDVVIIGTGAGGGDARAPARHERCEGSLAGARAVPAPGARQLADRGGVRTREVHRARDLV